MRRSIPGLVFAASVLGMGAFLAVEIVRGSPEVKEDPLGFAVLGVVFLLFPLVGWLITHRHPGHRVGFVFLLIGLLTGVGGAAESYSQWAVRGNHASVLGTFCAWFANWWWYPLLGLVTTLTILYFPTGKLPSKRWRWLEILVLGSMATITLVGMIQPRLRDTEKGRVLYDLDNPVGIRGLGDPEHGPLAGPLFAILAFCVVAAVISMIVRFRRSRGEERQQLKWFTLAVIILPFIVFLPDLIGEEWLPAGNTVFALAIGFLPVSVGIAILKYHLYDVDLIINRALVYGALSAALAALYLGGVALIQTLLPTGGNDLAVAASTLAVAGAFAPGRRRIQQFVDHRFYRRKYDAVQTIHDFSSRLRQETDLDELRADLLDVIQQTMQPAHASVWIRPMGVTG